MRRCRRLWTLLVGPGLGPGPDPDPDLTPGLAPGAILDQDPESVATVLGLVPALTLRPTETTRPGTTRTTEGGSEATTEATAGLTTIAAEAVATTSVATTRTEAVATDTRTTGRAGEAATEEVAAIEVEAGMIVTMTRTTTRTAPGGGAHAPEPPRSVQVAAAVLATPTARLQGDLGAPGAPATPLVLALQPLAIAVARASPLLRTQRKRLRRASQRSLCRRRMAAPLRKRPVANGSTMTQAPRDQALIQRKVTLLLDLLVQQALVLCGRL